MLPQLTIVISVYNKEQNILSAKKIFETCLQSDKLSSQVLFVTDGSKDNGSFLLRKMIQANRQSYLFRDFMAHEGIAS